MRDGVCTLQRDGQVETIAVPGDDLLVVQRFGDPVYPTLTPLGSVQGGPVDKPTHAVINGENFHALQLLAYACEGQVDCIYIDPPYNTGARDWRYNNRYVDETDSWRHSKWLSFMDKRLRLAKGLLKPDGILMVTVDEHELHHLGLLVESVFPDPDYLRYTITIVSNPKGTYKVNFGRVDEQVLFVVPRLGYDLINPRPAVAEDIDDPAIQAANGLIRRLVELLGASATELAGYESALDPSQREALIAAIASTGTSEDVDSAQLEIAELGQDDEASAATSGSRPAGYDDLFLRRRGQESSHRNERPNQFYAILVDEAKREVVGVGPLLQRDDPWESTRDGDVVTVYPLTVSPIDSEVEERVWRYSRETMQRYIAEGAIVVTRHNSDAPQPWTLNHRRPQVEFRRLRTVWWDKSHDAGTHGTNVVNLLLGQRNLFPFPKSVYAVRDCLAAAVRNRPDALIVDFFAGSGTTFHATCLLNAEDDGRRRTILVTNNEVPEKLANALQRDGAWAGDAAFECHGIFEAVTRPRCSAVVSGERADGSVVRGHHRSGRPYAEGFPENVEYFRLDYLDPDNVALGHRFDALQTSLWLGAGAIGERPEHPNTPWLVPSGARYAVLFRESRFRGFLKEVAGQPDLDIVYLVTDSRESYAEMCDALPRHLRTQMLYRDYLRAFRVKNGDGPR
jgi:adenine-specific DNA-methyltransferase